MLNRRSLGRLCVAAGAGVLSGQVFRPSEAVAYDYNELSQEIGVLESAANKLNLPSEGVTRGPIKRTFSDHDYYLRGMPRLVELIDRSGDNVTGQEVGNQAVAEIANRAAVLLSQLNQEVRSTQPLTNNRGQNPSPESLKEEYISLFGNCEVRTDRKADVLWYCKFIEKHKTLYDEVVRGTNIPWYFVATIHGREASFNFLSHLHNGDYPLTSRTVHEPKGRPDPWLPPTGWIASARDALEYKGLLSRTDWSLYLTLYRLEAYNGFGYRARSVRSPYLWSFSNLYNRGKYISDGKWDRNAMDQQCGTAVVLRILAAEGYVKI